MRNFNQGGGSRFGANRGGSSNGPRFGGNDRGPVTMHKAICSECGNSCEVPFRPTGDKPIFCNDCFSAKRGGEAPRAPRGGSFGGDRFSSPRKDFGSRPPMRPSFSENRGGGNDDVKKQLEFLGLKIDRLVKAIENMTPGHAHSTPEKSAQVKEAIKEATTGKKAVTKVVKAKEVKTPAKKVAVKKAVKKSKV